MFQETLNDILKNVQRVVKGCFICVNDDSRLIQESVIISLRTFEESFVLVSSVFQRCFMENCMGEWFTGVEKKSPKLFQASYMVASGKIQGQVSWVFHKKLCIFRKVF